MLISIFLMYGFINFRLIASNMPVPLVFLNKYISKVLKLKALFMFFLLNVVLLDLLILRKRNFNVKNTVERILMNVELLLRQISNDLIGVCSVKVMTMTI